MAMLANNAMPYEDCIGWIYMRLLFIIEVLEIKSLQFRLGLDLGMD